MAFIPNMNYMPFAPEFKGIKPIVPLYVKGGLPP
jgi:hypothetical protein